MNSKVIIAIGIILVCVIAAQAYYTYNLSKQVASLQEAQEPFPQQPMSPDSLPKGTPRMPDPFHDLDPFKDDWNPFEEMQRMQNEMNKIFGDMRSQLQQHPNFDDLNRNLTFAPNVDIKDKQDHYLITVDIPGADESNIQVNLENNQLHISATTKKSTAQDKNGGDMLRSERFYGQFQRTITLPSPVVAEKMQTDYKDGVLTITVPKK